MSKVVSHRWALTRTFFSPKIFLALNTNEWIHWEEKETHNTPPKQKGESKKVHNQKL
jgi:hypothetical protein